MTVGGDDGESSGGGEGVRPQTIRLGGLVPGGIGTIVAMVGALTD